uniref:Uncharacterized protein n=1 Tax=Arundo donax TaxID=35708 RepID=A0A0A8ZBW0_ARUDO
MPSIQEIRRQVLSSNYGWRVLNFKPGSGITASVRRRCRGIIRLPSLSS